MQTDGNFVLYAADRGVVWTADTTGPGAQLVLQDDRNLVILAADGTTLLWTPNCYGHRGRAGRGGAGHRG